MKFVQARWFHEGANGAVNRIVLHDAEYPEKITGAEDVAAYFEHVERKASAHYVCDVDSTVQCVKEADVAFHAPPNTGSIGIELVGYAKQTTADWLDAYGLAMLKGQAVPLIRDLASRHRIPLRWLTPEQLRAGWKGITSHNNVSLAFHQSTHTDPGGNFPVDQLMAWITGTAPEPEPPTLHRQDDAMLIFSTKFDDPQDSTEYLLGEHFEPITGPELAELLEMKDEEDGRRSARLVNVYGPNAWAAIQRAHAKK